jgi:hypothetical protein
MNFYHNLASSISSYGYLPSSRETQCRGNRGFNFQNLLHEPIEKLMGAQWELSASREIFFRKPTVNNSNAIQTPSLWIHHGNKMGSLHRRPRRRRCIPPVSSSLIPQRSLGRLTSSSTAASTTIRGTERNAARTSPTACTILTATASARRVRSTAWNPPNSRWRSSADFCPRYSLLSRVLSPEPNRDAHCPVPVHGRRLCHH